MASAASWRISTGYITSATNYFTCAAASPHSSRLRSIPQLSRKSLLKNIPLPSFSVFRSWLFFFWYLWKRGENKAHQQKWSLKTPCDTSQKRQKMSKMRDAKAGTTLFLVGNVSVDFCVLFYVYFCFTAFQTRTLRVCMWTCMQDAKAVVYTRTQICKKMFLLWHIKAWICHLGKKQKYSTNGSIVNIPSR